MNKNINETLEQNLSKDPETKGFDLQAGKTWIYPTNYPVREYQYSIIQKALLKNTLVSLPTGLGKTFIAAVVMFNYFRWYPLGKVIFMAPTRPLVKQQIDACYDIMAIPKDCTVEITGAKLSNTREEIWQSKRVFFITPQILQNDLDKFESLGSKIKCLVFDEAHRAKGNHAYCQVIKKLSNTNKFFRVLALSATPGGSINDVIEIVQNLLISHLEFRTEDSPDVSPYVFHRNLTTIVVPLGDKLQEVKDTYMKVLEYYTRNLIRYNVVQGNCANLTKGKIFMLMKNYQATNRGTSPNYAEIMKSLNICITLYHAAELLIRHGLRSFLTFFEEHIDKPLLRGNTEIRNILVDIREYIGPLPQIQQLPDGEYPKIPEHVKFGHPKFYKLRNILIDHFKEVTDSSRVIVFFEYRESVMEAFALLIQSKPVLNPRIFIGQKNGVTQKSQISVVKAFREGTCNVLLSTCIGEEGLDVGEVDLIICFDISNKSPIRMVQRMGRTGRKKDGQIVVLVTEGKEQQTLKDCLIHKNNVAFHVLGSKELAKGLQTECPKLIPNGIIPKCEKIFITVKKPEIKKIGSLKDMLRTLSSKSEPTFSPNLEIHDIEERIPSSELLSTKENPFDESPLPNILNNKNIEKQRSFQEVHKIQHSNKCELLVSLLRLAESRRFNIPMSQINMTTQSKNMKQADIRNMLLKSQNSNDFILPSTQVITEPVPIINLEDNNFGNPELFTELTNFLAIQMDGNKRCRLCPAQLNCEKVLHKKNSSETVLSWIELDASVYTNVTVEDLKRYERDLDGLKNESFQFEESMNFQVPNTPAEISTQKEAKTIELEDLIDISILADLSTNTSHFQAPKSLNNLLGKYSTSIIDEEVSQQVNSITNDTRNMSKAIEAINSPIKSATNVENEHENSIRDTLKDTDNIKRQENIFSEEYIKSTLNFFHLDSLDSMFVDIPSSQDTLMYTPDIFDETMVTDKQKIIEEPSSPILCSNFNKRKRHVSSQSTPTSSSLHKSANKRKRIDFENQESNIQVKKPETRIDLGDMFDFSFFGLPSAKNDQSIINSETIISLTDSCTKNDFREDPGTQKNVHNLDISEMENLNDEEFLGSPKLCAKKDPKSIKEIINQSGSNRKNEIKRMRKEFLDSLDLDQENMGSDNCDLVREKSKRCTDPIAHSPVKKAETSRSVGECLKSPKLYANKDLKSAKDTNRKNEVERLRKEFLDSLDFDLEDNEKSISTKVNGSKKGSDYCEKEKAQSYTDPIAHSPQLFPFKKAETSRSVDDFDLPDFSNCDDNLLNQGSIADTSYFIESNVLSKSLDYVRQNEKRIQVAKEEPKGGFASKSSHCESQNSITQMISMINKPTHPNIARKEKLSPNVPDLDDDLFNFTSCHEDNNSPKSLDFLCLEEKYQNENDIPKEELDPKSSVAINTERNQYQDKCRSQAFVTTPSSRPNKSLKEKMNPIVSDFDDDFFDFSFNTKKPTKLNKIINEKSLKSPAKLSKTNDKLKTNEPGQSSIEKSSKYNSKLNISSHNSSLNDSTKLLNSSLNTSHSDDEFETKPSSPVWIRPKYLPKKNKTNDRSNGENKSPVFVIPKPINQVNIQKKLNRPTSDGSTRAVNGRKLVNQFIENEAEFSFCEEICISDDEDEDSLSQDQYDASFVADETQEVNTEMHAVYLKSVKSPRLANRFKIPMRFHNRDVFSQLDNVEEDFDSDDSFVVHDESIEANTQLSQLEILENQLEMQRKRKKMPNGIKKPIKRKRILIESDSD